MALWERFSSLLSLMNKRKHIPVYQQLVKTVRTGYLALDDSTQNEINTFIKGQQKGAGGFTDRAGHPDLYYSLFGMWLSMATGQTELLRNLKEFTAKKPAGGSKSPVDDLALLLIKAGLNYRSTQESPGSVIKIVFKRGKMIELSYRLFLISLVVDAYGKNRGSYHLMARIWLIFYRPGRNIPCSLTAALTYARKMLGLNTRKIQTRLLEFLVDEGGFRSFETVKTADTLSTGVALFVLKQANFDLRLITPGCLEFVQNNYEEGAFLSGDGDITKDLEYTFYGLLAIGSLINN